MKGVNNVACLAMQRETHINRRNSGIASKEMLAAAEEKAASCEMEEISCQLPENTRSTFLVTFSPDGTKVASAHGNHKIYVSDVRTGKCLHTLEGHPRTPWCIAFHPSYNDILASGCLGGEVRVWDLHGGCEVWTGEKNTAIASLAFHPSDHVLVIATINIIYFWSWSLSVPFAWCKTASEKERVRFVRFDPYGHHLFTGIVNVTTVNRQRDEIGRPILACDREQEESNLHERLFLLNEQHRHLLHRLQELQSHASGTREEVSTPDPIDRPPSPSVADALRMARDYAADFTYLQLNRETSQMPFTSASHTENRNNSNDHSEPSTSQANLAFTTESHSPRNDGSPRLSFQELQENLRSMRIRYTRICERLREVLVLRSRSSDDLTNSNVAAANLVYSLLTFWREYETMAVSLQQSSLQYSTTSEPNRDARRHIAHAMVSLLHLQDMLHSSLLHRANDVSERGMARLIHNILMTLLELATLDTNILALRTTALEAIGRTVHAQWATSVQRPEARRQRGPSSLNSTLSAASTSSLPSMSRLNTMSWHSSGNPSSAIHQLATFRHMQTGDSSASGRPEAASAFSQPRHGPSTAQLSGGNPFRASSSRTSIAMRSLSLHSRSNEQYGGDMGYSVTDVGAGSQGSTDESGGTMNDGDSGSNSSQQQYGRSLSQQQEFQLNLSSTEQLLRSILEELLNLLGSTSSSVPNNGIGSASNSSSSSSSASSTSTSSPNVGQPTPSFPSSWFSYWNRIWNVRSNHLDFTEPLLVTRATYRIQCWDFTEFQIPDISNAQTNIVVPECLIQNDANIEISADGRLLATLVPSSVLTYTLLAVHSLQPDTFGQCLYLWSFCSSVISISLSPMGRYVLVGLGSNRRSFTSHGGKLIIGQVLQLVEGRDEKKEYLQHVRTVELRGENRFDVSLNSMRWLPLPGEGLVYGTNRGDLRICRPRSCSDPWIKPTVQSSTTAPRRTYRDIVARVLARRTSLHHPSFTRLVFPTTNSTATQTESDSDSG